MKLYVQVQGVKEAVGVLSRLRVLAAQRVKDAINKSALAIQRNAKRLCPVDTGRLRSSIALRFYMNGLAAEVGTDVVYAPAVEFGSGMHGERRRPYIIRPKRAKVLAWPGGGSIGGFKQKGGMVFAQFVKHPGVRPRPFLIPAYEAEKPQLVENIKTAIEGSARGAA